MDAERNMSEKSQLDFRLKVFILELDFIRTTIPSTATIATSSSSSSSVEATPTQAVAIEDYVTRTIETIDIGRSDIDYRAEGNANIVLAIPHRCQVLRLPKKSKRLFHSFFLSFFPRYHKANSVLVLNSFCLCVILVHITYI